MLHFTRSSNLKPWNSARATLYGAALGAAAAAVKLFAPWSQPHAAAPIIREFVGAALAFALLCGTLAVLRNIVVRRLTDADLE